MALTTSGDVRGPGGSSRVSTKTKSLPDPLILKNSRPNGIIASNAPRQGRETQTPHHQNGFSDNMAGHFARPLGPVHEDDRHLDDAEFLPPGAKVHFDLERVAVGSHVVEVD